MTARESGDGRERRAERGRQAVSDALVELIAETGAMPDISLVARRAGVGRRSVFRYFDGVGALELETGRAMRRLFTERVPLPGPRGALPQRLDALVRHRARLYELLTPVRRFLDGARARGRPEIDALVDEGRHVLRAHLRTMLMPELAANPQALVGLDLVTSWEAWRALREGSKLPVPAARRELRRLLGLLIAPRRAARRGARPRPARARSTR